MEQTKDSNQAAFAAIKQGAEANSTNAPQVSIDPDSDKLSVVGDPNLINQTNGTYKLTFRYRGDEISDSDKAQMKYDEVTEEYTVDVTYENKRVKPLYREKITLLVADLFDKLGMITTDGYDIEALRPEAGRILMENVETIAEMARLVCGIPKEQVEQLDTEGLATFINQFLVNEPNILKEAVVFLAQRLRQRQEKEVVKETTPVQNTPQN